MSDSLRSDSSTGPACSLVIATAAAESTCDSEKMYCVAMKKLLVILTASCVLGNATASAQQSPPDLILFNGKIFTAAPSAPYARALAIRGATIMAVGDTATVGNTAGPGTKKIDLGGRTVIPGINDAHNHLGLPPETIEFKNGDPSVTELREALAGAVERLHTGALIYGWINQTAYFDPSLDRRLLDELAPRNPVVLFVVTGHACVLNSAALRKFGIGDRDADPLGGKYDREADGRLDGVLREYAALKIERRLADATSDADLVKELRESLLSAAKLGVTSVQDMSGALAPERALRLFNEATGPVRVRVIRMPGSDGPARNIGEGLSVLHHEAGWISVSGTKWMLDGTPLEGTFNSRAAQAAFFAEANRARAANPVPAPLERFLSNMGLTFSREQIPRMLRESLEANDQLIVHMVGYPAAHLMVNAMEESGGKGTWSRRRIRFEHGSGLFPDLIERTRDLGAVVVVNPSQLTWKRHFSPDFTFVRAQPLKSLISAGIPVAFGSDRGGDFDPFQDIMFAITHPDRPSEAITREQAVTAYTLTSAYAEFAEQTKGSLEVGKFADLAVLSQDIFAVPASELPKTVAVLTLVGGKAVYDAHVLSRM